jgi:hypothetical protein
MLKKILPQKIWNFLRSVWFFFINRFRYLHLIFLQNRYKKTVRRIQKKDKIKVAFFLIHESVWKYDRLYKLMVQDNRFDPIVVVCPHVVYGMEHMLREMDQAYNAFSEKGYKIFRTFNKITSEWLDVKGEIKPDIIFFTNPHDLTHKKYSINNFLNTLSCYVPYTFQTTFHYQENYNGFFHNALWKAYYPTILHCNMAVRFGLNKGKNAVLSGYPFIDRFLSLNGSGKINEKVKLKKNIIWAPHHTIEEAGMDLHFSNFNRYHNFMIQLAKDYSDKIFITFKPHPALRPKLINSKTWGREKTEKYFKFWQESDFCALNEGNYELLFEESDAMIHDCDSFMGEYLSLNKPVLYTRRDDNVTDRLNEFGRAANKMHYQAGNEEEIIKFINEVVINEADTMKDNRTKWIRDFITPPNNREAAMNIYIDLKDSLGIE